MVQDMLKNNLEKTGKIVSVFSGVAKVFGLNNVFLNEVLTNKDNKESALVIGFDENYVEVLLFHDKFSVSDLLFSTGKSFSINISDSIIGRVLNGFGEGVDGFGKVHGEKCVVFRDAPPVNVRKKITRPLTTGVKIIDTTLPLGRGQRELIIGDRKLGKSTIAIDTVLNQENIKEPIICIYVLIGQKRQKIKELLATFDKNNTFLYAIVVAVPPDASFAELYLAPFVGTSIGEYFRDLGKDVLIIYDDLTKHAKSYRDVSLLLERIPGRESYPGDIFSLHAKLLERSAQLSDEYGGGSLTALPIIETQQGDITSFIPTNIISITDGQIYLENGLFQKGFLPAVNVGLSVSRIGSAVQPEELKKIVSGIRLVLAQQKELQKLSKLETKLSKQAIDKIHRGELILELLKQDKNFGVTWTEQVILFYTVENGYFDDIEKEKWSHFEKFLIKLLRGRYFKIMKKIEQENFDEEIKLKVKEIVADAKNEFTNI